MSQFNPKKYAWAKCVPEILVTDFQKSLNFYRLLGFSDMYQRSKFAYLEYKGAQFMIFQRDGSWETGDMHTPFGRGVNFQFSTDELDTIIEKLTKAGISLYEPKHEKWRDIGGVKIGSTEFLVQDPDGYLLRFLEPAE
jgi:catechol 2,3-dioxygenase-like lactoylglutathione lyase family enzyme